MTRLAWTTDSHFPFMGEDGFVQFFDELRAINADALALTGDIADGASVHRYLLKIRKIFDKPVYFVHGNHDYYRSSIAEVRRASSDLTRTISKLVWLPNRVVKLNETWGLVGVDGWGDARYGNPDAGQVQLNDERCIGEFTQCQAAMSHQARVRLCRFLGDEEAQILRSTLFDALNTFPKVLVLTHVPPFPGAAWHEGKNSEEHWLPWFACKAVGDVLLEAVHEHPEKELLVLTGHTHSADAFQATPNMLVRTGAAAYGTAFIETIECQQEEK